MKQGTFMVIAAALAFVFGLAFILVPAQLMSFYGVTLQEGGQWIARFLGSAFLGIAALTWLGRNVAEGEAMRAILLGDFVLSVTGLIVAVLDAILGPGNAFLWLDVAIYVFLTVGFGYFQFISPARS